MCYENLFPGPEVLHKYTWSILRNNFEQKIIIDLILVRGDGLKNVYNVMTIRGLRRVSV